MPNCTNPRPERVRTSRTERRVRAVTRAMGHTSGDHERRREHLPLISLVRGTLQVLSWASLPVFRNIIWTVQQKFADATMWSTNSPTELVAPNNLSTPTHESVTNDVPSDSTSSPSANESDELPDFGEVEDCCMCYTPTNERLPCSHAVCLNCAILTRANTEGSARCPMCRRFILPYTVWSGGTRGHLPTTPPSSAMYQWPSFGEPTRINIV